jgi:methylphosphotriester-DNA--protein-cysteine methyltransferase
MEKIEDKAKAKKGDKIWFRPEKKPYQVRAFDERFIICTKPYNPQRTVMYTIIDLQKGIRGTENLVFCMGFESDEDCMEALKRLQTGETEVSYRNRVSLDIVKIQQK